MKEPHAKHHQIERAVAAAAWASLLVLTLTGATNSGAQPAPHFAAAKPTIVLVHGDWADGSSWAAVTENLQRKGFTVDVLANPLRGVNSDASYQRDYLATVPGPIVLVGHSYGGMVITNAATGNPNVKELVYIGQPVGGRDLLHGRAELASDLGEHVALDHRVQLVALHSCDEDDRHLGRDLEGWPETLTTQPAAWTVPLAFTVMVAVSIATRRRTPADVGATMLCLHARPETLRL